MRGMKAVLAAASLAVAVPTLAMAQATSPPMGAPAPIQGTLLSVNAEGKVTAAPDMGVISLGVVTDGDTAAAAMAANSQRMNALMAALRRAGIAERDVQTSNLSVNPQYQYVENQPPHLTGYQANNQVTVKVRNLARMGNVVDAAVAAGGNTVNGISFTFQDVDAQIDRARTDAITEARHRADLYAHALGMQVARVISVSEGGGYSPPMPMPVMMMARAEAAPAPPPVAPGEVDTTASVSVVFELR
ncbi:MAG: SIMPL domain-containing protein [Pseudomonadota bacterium]